LTRAGSCDDVRCELGVYLLGAIAPADRSTVETHLASCASCRNQLVELAGLPALLGRVPLDDVASSVKPGGADAGNSPADRALGSLLSEARKRRRLRVWSRVLVATAAGLAVGAIGTFSMLGTPPPRPLSQPPPRATTVRGSDLRTGASAVVTYTGRPWGVQLDVQVSGIAAGTKCVFKVISASGRESEAGSWTVAASEGDAWYAASAAVPVTSVRGFVVAAGAQTLVRVGAAVTPARAEGAG